MDQAGSSKDMDLIIISIVLSSSFVVCTLLLAPLALITMLWCNIWYRKYNCSYSPVCKRVLQREAVEWGTDCTIIRLVCRFTCCKVEDSNEVERNRNSTPLDSVDRVITDTDVPKYDQLSIADELPSYLQACSIYENECKETQATAVCV